MKNNRLRTIADMITPGMIVCDIGTDHAYLPLLLAQRGQNDKIYAIDNKIGPLTQAKKTIEENGMEDFIFPILSDGLDKAPEDIQSVVIAGMGGEMILQILEKIEDFKDIREVIVQGNTSVQKIRQYISEHQYSILDEKTVYDYHYYTVIRFSLDKGRSLNEEEIWLGPVLMETKEETFMEYLKYRYYVLKSIDDAHTLNDDTEYRMIRHFLAASHQIEE